MSDSRSMSRRTALSGLGAGGLGLVFASQAARVSAHGSVMPSRALVDHPLTGLWLAMVALPSNPDVTVAVPSIFGADGSIVLVFPSTEGTREGVQIKGAAVGTWEAVDERSGHFTTVQVLSSMEGTYLGSLTLDGYPSVTADGQAFDDNGAMSHSTTQDRHHEVVETGGASSLVRMSGFRMVPGNPGFSAAMNQIPLRYPDPRIEE